MAYQRLSENRWARRPGVEAAHVEIWEVMNTLIILIEVMVSCCMHLLKANKLYTFNKCSLLYFNYILIKLQKYLAMTCFCLLILSLLYLYFSCALIFRTYLSLSSLLLKDFLLIFFCPKSASLIASLTLFSRQSRYPQSI